MHGGPNQTSKAIDDDRPATRRRRSAAAGGLPGDPHSATSLLKSLVMSNSRHLTAHRHPLGEPSNLRGGNTALNQHALTQKPLSNIQRRPSLFSGGRARCFRTAQANPASSNGAAASPRCSSADFEAPNAPQRPKHRSSRRSRCDLPLRRDSPGLSTRSLSVAYTSGTPRQRTAVPCRPGRQSTLCS